MNPIHRKSLTSSVILLALATLTGGCIAYVVPVNSWEESSLQENDFEQYLGMGNDEVVSHIGMPTFILSSSDRSETYYLYERARFVESEWGHYGLKRYTVWPAISGDSGRVTSEDGKSCYLLVFNTDNKMIRYDADWIHYSPDGRGGNERTNVPGNPLRTTPDLDCRTFFWSEEELTEITNVDF